MIIYMHFLVFQNFRINLIFLNLSHLSFSYLSYMNLSCLFLCKIDAHHIGPSDSEHFISTLGSGH